MVGYISNLNPQHVAQMYLVLSETQRMHLRFGQLYLFIKILWNHTASVVDDMRLIKQRK